MKDSKLTERCKECVHCSYMSGLPACLYIIDELEPRGCKIDDNCDKFKEGSRDGTYYVPLH